MGQHRLQIGGQGGGVLADLLLLAGGQLRQPQRGVGGLQPLLQVRRPAEEPLAEFLADVAYGGQPPLGEFRQGGHFRPLGERLSLAQPRQSVG